MRNYFIYKAEWESIVRNKNIWAVILFGVVFMALFITACSNAPSADPPENQRLEYLPVYIAWDGAGGESWDYEVSVEGIIEESGPPPVSESIEGDDAIDIFVDDEMPGGRILWFIGVSPGDTTLTFTTKNEGGETVGTQTYAIRVYKDLKIALLNEESTDNR